jgi:hypothetical protein
MKAQARQFIKTVVLTCTICAMSANAQTQSSPAIPSVTTPSKNASQKIEPRKVVDSAAFRAAVAEARKAMDAGDFAAAEKAYAQAIAADSSNSRAQFNQGVAQYKSQNLQGSSASFATAGQIGDPAVAEGAMFNQGDVAYSGAIKIIDSDDFKEPVAASAQDQNSSPKRKEAIDAAIEAATRALTHFKDAASADQLDIDARFNAEAATRLLKMLELEKKEEEKKQEDKKQEDKKEEEKKEEDKKGDQGEPKDDQSKGDQPKDQDQQEKDKQDKEGKKDEGEKGEKQEGKNPDKSEEKKEENKPDQSKDGKEESPKPKEQGEKPAEAQKPGEEAQDQESKGQESKGQAPQAGEPVKDAPLTKQEADRLLQAVRDREKSRKEDREAKELQKPTRRTPASKDW